MCFPESDNMVNTIGELLSCYQTVMLKLNLKYSWLFAGLRVKFNAISTTICPADVSSVARWQLLERWTITSILELKIK